MHKFRDDKDKEWEVKFTTDELERVKDESGVDLMTEALSEKFLSLSVDVRRLGQLLWVVCSKQAEADEISPEEFVSRMYGDTWDRAFDAITEELNDFFPSQVRTIFRTAMNAERELRDQTLARIEETVKNGKVAELIKTKMEEVIERTLGRPFTDSQESLDSTPDLARSDS